MSRLLYFLAASAFAFAFSIATSFAADPDPKTFDRPPAGLHQSEVKLAALIKQHDTAVGQLAAAAKHGTTEHWSFTLAGSAGTEVLQHAGSDYRSHIVQGPFTQDFGQFNGVRWHRDENGFTSQSTSIDDDSFAPLRALDDLDDAKNDISIAGETSDAKPAVVVKVSRPRYRHPEWVFVDKSTGFITRIESGYGTRYYTHSFDDYRATNGRTEPWHIHDTDGRVKLDADWVRQSLDRSTPIDPAQFVPAPNASTINQGMDTSIPLPAKMFRGDVVVRMSVHGRGLDFLVDCASADSIIDRNVAHDLSLPTFDQLTEADGTRYWYRTIIDDATLGPIRMRNFVMSAGSYTYDVSGTTRVVGVLGYDFLAQNVLKIDYINATAELIPSSKFSAKDIAGSYIVPLTFDDRLPLVPAQFGTSTNAHIAINNALRYNIAFSSLIDKYPSDFKDPPNEHRSNTLVPFADDSSFGSQAEVWLTQVSHLRFGPADYQQLPIVATNFPYDVNGQSIDGMIGLNFLSYFDCYYDYPHNQLVLKPNAEFFKTFHAN